MVAGAILPVAIHKNKLYFLFGREGPTDETPGWSDFGGGVEKGEDPYQTALREGGEELTGFLGDGKDVERLIKSGGGFYKSIHGTSYHIHIFLIEYDANLPIYFNKNRNFLMERMDNKYLSKTKLFEKAEIGWFSIQDMQNRRTEFRKFYQEFVSELLDDMPKIEAFLRKNHKSKPKTRTKTRTKSRIRTRTKTRTGKTKSNKFSKTVRT